jgi:hypothetical protein
MRHRFWLGLAGACALAAAVAEEPGSRYSLSIYSAAANNGEGLFAPAGPEAGGPGGYAIVRDRRQFDLKAGANVVQVRDVSRYLDPAALSARPLGDSEAEILSQRFEDETLSLDALVQKHLGHPVEIHVGGGNQPSAAITGTLLSNVGGLSIQGPDGRVSTVTEFNRITFPDLPKGLAATPSLRWDIAAKKAGTQSFEIVYPTQGLAWRAEYSGWLATGDCRLMLSGWAQIANRSGTDYPDSRIKLIAGEPHRVSAATTPRVMARAGAMAMQAEETGAAGDYHEYSVDTPADLGSGTLLRVALFAGQNLPCQRQYSFEASRLRANPGMAPITERSYGGGEQGASVRSMLTFRSERALPAGTLRILQNAADGTPEFIGEDALGHTPRGQTLNVELGNAFDLRGERKQTDFQFDKEHRTLNESFSIRLSNAGNGAQAVVVREHLFRWTQWNITQSSLKFDKRNADTVEFNVDVPANGNAQLTYTVQYQWNESFK